MCLVSDKIKFCTCLSGSVDKLQHYWLLYRYDKTKGMFVVGLPAMPFHLLQPSYELNKIMLVKRLNEKDAFDFEITFQDKDQLEIVFYNNEDDIKRMVFCFKYSKDKWKSIEYDCFDLMNRFNETRFGKCKQMKKH